MVIAKKLGVGEGASRSLQRSTNGVSGSFLKTLEKLYGMDQTGYFCHSLATATREKWRGKNSGSDPLVRSRF